MCSVYKQYVIQPYVSLLGKYGHAMLGIWYMAGVCFVTDSQCAEHCMHRKSNAHQYATPTSVMLLSHRDLCAACAHYRAYTYLPLSICAIIRFPSCSIITTDTHSHVSSARCHLPCVCCISHEYTHSQPLQHSSWSCATLPSAATTFRRSAPEHAKWGI